MVKLIGFKKINLAVFISGKGSNLKNLIDFTLTKKSKFQIRFIISNNAKAKGLKFAKKFKIQKKIISFQNTRKAESQILKIIKKNKINLICLAGFMTILSKDFLLNWENKVLNIHPSLLPSFRGKNAVDQALRKGVKFTGCTVHIVDSGIDTGTILDQEIVKVSKNDSTESLKKKILKKEHYLYIKVIKKLEKYFENVKDR